MPDIIARGMAAAAKSLADLANERIGHIPKGIRYIGTVDNPSELPAVAAIGDCYTVRYNEAGQQDGREYIYGEVGGTLQWTPIGAELPLVGGPIPGSILIDGQNNVIDNPKGDTGVGGVMLGTGGLVTADRGVTEGEGTQALEYNAHAEGDHTIASGGNSHAEGQSTKATNKEAHVEGYKSEANGERSHAEGRSKANGDYSHSEGRDTNASGARSHTEGYRTIASGDNSHAEGDKSQATAASSHAEGLDTEANGFYSHAENEGTIAAGVASHAGGLGAQAIGQGSFSHGYDTIANAQFSIALGIKTEVNEEAGFASGKYNIAYEPEIAPEEGYAPNIDWDHSGSELHITSVPDLLQFVKLINDGEDDFYEKTIYLDSDLDVNPGWKATVSFSGNTGAGLPENSGNVTLPSAPVTSWTNTCKSKSNSADQPFLFRGTFDGQGHTIYGIYYNRTSEGGSRPVCKNCGLLFNRAEGAHISNFSVRNSIFMWSENVGNSEVGFGGIVGGLTADSTLIDVYSEVTMVLRSNAHRKAAVGGVVGWQGSGVEISRCVYKGKIIETVNSNSFTYPAAAQTRQIGGIAGESESGWMQNCVGIVEFAVREPLGEIQAGDQSTNNGAANQAVAGHYGNDWGTLEWVYEGAQMVMPSSASNWEYQSYVGSFIPAPLAERFFNDFVITPLFQHGDGSISARHDAFSVGIRGLKYATESNEYFLQVGDLIMSASQLAALLDSLKAPNVISIEMNSWVPLSDAAPFQYQASVASPVQISPTSTVELINNNAVLFANYGFAIGDISGQTITIYAIDQPSIDVNLGVKIYG